MSSLRTALDSLAQSFASGVLAAIRGASIEDLLAESGGGGAVRRGPGRPRGSVSAKHTEVAAPAAAVKTSAKTTRGGRLARRSAAEITKAVDQVVALVKRSKGGLRSEEIRKQLALDVREVPRILRTGVESKKLKSKGQKRATVYSAS